jgi:hypothetical protein
MTYTESILGKKIFDLTYQDIETFFITEKEENLNLEFKSYPAQGNHKDKENVIKKSVCALLNSEGGVIIWGAPMETRDQKASGALTPFNAGLDKDKLINILSSVIIPMPTGIKVNFLSKNEANSIVIIEVEKSIEKPHQYDNRYYIRLDGQTRIAPHYLIKALMESQDFPIIRGHIKLKEIETDGSNIILTFKKLLFNTSKFNNEKNPFYKILCAPGDIYVNSINYNHEYDNTFSILSNGRPDFGFFKIVIPSHKINEELNIIFQFGGEKSPAKMSKYKYMFTNGFTMGIVTDENIYQTYKDENKLPSDTSRNTDDENINRIMEL